MEQHERRVTKVFAPDDAGVTAAARLLRAGETVAFPTETVYGLGGLATDDRAVARIYAAKERPSFNPLIVHVDGLAAAERLAVFDEFALKLARAFWPGPLTLVLPARETAGLSQLVTAGLPTVGIRVPAHDLARRLIAASGPLAAPSANPSGRISATSAPLVMRGLGGRIGGVLDGGPCKVGVESTIVGFDPAPVLLRPGGIAREEIEALVGPLGVAPQSERPTAPGQLDSHYAPHLPVRLDAVEAREGEVMLGFGPVAGDLTLSASGDLVEAAANLFAMLHELDRRGARGIAVAPIPETGLGLAINDRLRRAAAPRG